MRSKLATALESVRAGLADARARSPRTLALLVACLAIVAVGPLALTLLRADDYEARFTIAQAAALPLSDFSQREQVAGIQLLMGAITPSPGLQREVLEDVDWIDRRKEVTTRTTLAGRWRDGRPEAVITTTGPTSDQARALAESVSDSLSERAEPAALFGDALKPVIRSEGRAFARPTPVQGDEDRPGDRLLVALPGAPPSRPQPGWAALCRSGPGGRPAVVRAHGGP